MRLFTHALMLTLFCVASPLRAQDQPREPSPAEARDFSALQSLMEKTRQGGDKPTEQDLAARREAGREMAKRGRQFLQEHPSSGKVEDVRALTSIGLYEATVAGDAAAEKELEDFAAATIRDPKLPESLKLHAFAVNHIARWAKRNGKGSLDQGRNPPTPLKNRSTSASPQWTAAKWT